MNYGEPYHRIDLPRCGMNVASAVRHAAGALASVLLFAAALLSCAGDVWAVDAVKINGTEERIELTSHVAVMDGQGDNLRVNTAAGLDGVVRQMSVRATAPGTSDRGVGWPRRPARR